MAAAAAAAPPPPPTAAAGEGGFDEEAQQNLRNEIKEELQRCHGGPVPDVYPIQRHLMRQGDLAVPHHVWIGPSNWGGTPVELNREHEKLKCLKQLLLQANTNAAEGNNDLLLQLIKDLDEKLGNTSSYRGCEGLQRKEFVRRMLLDGCYIVYKFARCPPRDNGGPSPGLQGSHHDLHHMKLVDHCCGLITKCMDGIRRIHHTHDQSDDREMEPVNNNNNNNNNRTSGQRARWLECRDTWCLVNNHVPYDVLDVINRLVYKAPEGGFGGASARILLQWWSMYYYVPAPSQVHLVDRATVQQDNCLLILLAQLLTPQRRDSPLLNRTCCPPLGGPLLQGAEQLLYPWRPATEYVRCCNARFVASPLDATERRTVLDVTATIRGCFCSIDVQVPPLTIDGCSLALLRSLVELEQRGITAERYVTAYCFFMHMIARQAEDVELLTRMGIINHVYTDPMVVARGLKEVVENAHARDADRYLFPIYQELERRYNNPFHMCMSWFRSWTWPDVLKVLGVLLSVAGVTFGALSYFYGKDRTTRG